MRVEMMKDKYGRKYELLPPEGGWGYLVTIAISLFFSVTVAPLCVFGMVFGTFLQNVGDETYGTALANGIFNTVLSFTGLAANTLLQRYSCRKVGLLGAFFFSLGSLGTAFVTSLPQLIITFGVTQGIGFGLLMPAGFTSFNGYFDKKQNVMMGICQSLVVGVTMLVPYFTKILLSEYGWRGTQLIFAGLSLNCFLAMIILQPVKWHMRRKYATNELQNEKGLSGNKTPLLHAGSASGLHSIHGQHLHNILERRRPSVISIGSMAVSVASVADIYKESKAGASLWSKLYESMDLGLFKSVVYVNIAFGLSLGLTADIFFLSLLPMILQNNGYSKEETTIVLTVYFASDLLCRVLLSVVSAIVRLRNRYLFLAGAIFSAIFRTALVMDTSFTWVICMCAALGFLRCLIQTPLPLVVAEQYNDRFSTAFTLYMVVCGVVFTVFGPLLGYVKEATQSDIWVVHLLTAAYTLCAIPWLIEIISTKLNSKAK